MSFLEIREFRDNPKIVWAFSHAMHNLPLQLYNVKSEEDYLEIFEEIKQRMKHQKLHKWFNNQEKRLFEIYSSRNF